jgi:hypothetical protein
MRLVFRLRRPVVGVTAQTAFPVPPVADAFLQGAVVEPLAGDEPGVERGFLIPSWTERIAERPEHLQIRRNGTDFHSK